MTLDGTTPDSGFDRRVTDWLEAGAAPRAPESLETAFVEGVATTRQRPAWATTGRWISMETRAQLGAVPRAVIMLATIALLLALAVGTYAVGSSLTRELPAPFGPADNGLVSFEHQGQIWVSRSDGSERQSLTDDTELTGAPVWSRDGTRFSYESSAIEDGPTEIVVRNADGSGRVSLTDPLDLSPGAHAWSPDGTTLLFSAALDTPPNASCRSDGAFCGSRIYRVNTDGSGHSVIGDPDLDAQGPVWAQDGSFVVFAGSQADSGSDYGLYRMDPDGGNVERIGKLSGDGFSFWRIDMSPDGTQVVTQVEGDSDDIYLVDLESGAATVVADGPVDEFDASFSPDGSQILFTQNSSEFVFEPRPVIVDTATLAQRPLDLRVWARRWSPDGSSLLGFSSGSGEVVTIDVDAETAYVNSLPASFEAGDADWQRITS